MAWHSWGRGGQAGGAGAALVSCHVQGAGSACGWEGEWQRCQGKHLDFLPCSLVEGTGGEVLCFLLSLAPSKHKSQLSLEWFI